MEFHEQPPPSRWGEKGPSAEQAIILRELKDNPGAWAIVAVVPDNKGRGSTSVTSYKRFGCDALTRKNPATGNIDVWASWPKEEEE